MTGIETLKTSSAAMTPSVRTSSRCERMSPAGAQSLRRSSSMTIDPVQEPREAGTARMRPAMD